MKENKNLEIYSKKGGFMEVFGLSITLLTFMLGYLAWRNGKWMRETTYKQTELLNKQIELLNKQTELLNKQTDMIGELKNVIIEEARLTREKMSEERKLLMELMERIDRTTKEILGKILEKVSK